MKRKIGYGNDKRVKLTLSQWLELQCALHDAARYNQEKGYRHAASGQRKLIEAIDQQVGSDLEACDLALQEV